MNETRKALGQGRGLDPRGEDLRSAMALIPEDLALALCQKGDEEGFRQLMSIYRGYVYSLCYSVIRDREESLDMCQEVFLAAFRGVGSVRTGVPLKPWLRRVAVNVCLNYRRSPRSGALLQLTADGVIDGRGDGTREVASTAGGWDGDPAEQVESKEAGSAVRAAMKDLPPDQRLAVLLFHQEGLSYNEIAAETGWPAGTVRTNLYRGRKELGRRVKALIGGLDS